ncbi:uncharacterized protein LOC62_06G008356 [Vanrija pseudolonga]|uniref:Glycosyltransferase family 18 catalytic domain-containing protein n=1 Tax=Vanrija pseudolonga TaxID=143232 RepID=A0AAF1BQH8_9TREE|nr:hypothetical protein LOC62_06G008356 [Vanrija pseudolonga]
MSVYAYPLLDDHLNVVTPDSSVPGTPTGPRPRSPRPRSPRPRTPTVASTPSSSPSMSSMDCDDTAPLLRGYRYDVADDHRGLFSEKPIPAWQRRPQQPIRRRPRGFFTAKVPTPKHFFMVVLGSMLFMLGWLTHTPPEYTIVKPDRPLYHPLDTAAFHRLDRVVKIRVLDDLLKERYPQDIRKPRTHNHNALARLAHCIESGTCGPHEQEIVILASYHFGGVYEGRMGGEEVWADSTIHALKEMNYTAIYTWTHMDTLFIYQSIPEMIKIIMWEPNVIEACMERVDNDSADKQDKDKWKTGEPDTWQRGQKGCMQRTDFVKGIPWWKSFAWHFWPPPVTPLGAPWTLAPENYGAWNSIAKNYYLGYTVEYKCKNYPFFSHREHRAMILAKNDEYLDKRLNLFHGLLANVRDAITPAPHPFLDDADDVKFSMLSTAGKAVPNGGTRETPEPGIRSVGRMPGPQWIEAVARSKVMIGLGDPILSPSPYDALCMGVPFINPIKKWKEEEPFNREHWELQHDALRDLDAPYVYHVFKGNETMLRDAVEQAVNNPIGRFIPERMTMKEIIKRHDFLINNDWQTKAIEYVGETYKDELDRWQHLTMDEFWIEKKNSTADASASASTSA